MRKNSPRKWLHALLDLLPVVIIPIFAIYSHRHTIDSYSVTREKYEVVNFQQYVYNGKPNTLNYIYNNGNGSISISNNYLKYSGGDTFSIYFDVAYLDANLNDKLFFTFESYDNGNYDYDLYLSGDQEITIAEPETFSTSNTKYQFLITSDYTTTYDSIIFLNDGIYDELFIKNVMIFNLTQMFGSGNEPTIAEFNQMFPNDYYEYTTSKKVLIQNGIETLNNSDIGSQLLYSLYNPIHDYMNFNNVFNFGEIYNWMQLNIFGGTAPLSVFIVWNIVLYEFLMDLIFLIYALFMFFIDFCTNLIDRFHVKCSGGK